MKNLFIGLLVTVFSLALVQNTSAQSGNLSITNNNGTYEVRFTPTWTGQFTLGASALVALKAELGTTELPQTVTDVTGGPWTRTSPKNSDAAFDYWGYTTSGNTPLSLVSGTTITLFTFPAPTCSGGTVSIVDPNNLPAGGTGIVNNFDYGTFFNSPISGNIAGVTGSGVACSGVFDLSTTTPPPHTLIPGTPKTGVAPTDLNPTGGNGPYTYTQDLSSTCVAPAGASPLPSSSGLTVDSSTGAYSYTAPNTPGTYYFCIKVCDSTTPTANCETATYTSNVQSVCAANAGTLN